MPKTIQHHKKAQQKYLLRKQALHLRLTLKMSVYDICQKLGVTKAMCTKWKKEDDWDYLEKLMHEGVKEQIKNEAIIEGVLTIDKIKDMQNDVITEAKRRMVESKDKGYRTAIALEELLIKKTMLKQGKNPMSILDIVKED